MQDVNLQLFGDSVLAEVRLGNTATEQDALTALDRMDLAQYADTHPMALSGGQKQRLLVARALAARPEILVLDDSSSALDYKTDAAMRKAIREHHGDSTLIMVAQRVSSIMGMTRILVMDNGKCVGYDTHQELLETCPAYQETYKVQMGEMA